MNQETHIRVGRHLYDSVIRTTNVPSRAECAEALSLPLSHINRAFERLASSRTIVLQTTSGEALMVPPFSAVPTSFYVQVGARSWWANCIWDGLGVLALLREDGAMATACPCCGDSLVVTVEAGELVRADGVPHYAIPLKDWWRDIFFA